MPQEEVSEEELLLRKRARRRLIGAFVVVIAMVLILPAVLEDKPQPVARDLSIILPPPSPSPEPVVAAAPPRQEHIPVPMPEPMPTPSAPAEPAKSDPPAKSTPGEPIAKPTPKPSAPTTKPAVDRFHVQIGVFSNSENVKQLQGKLAGQGVKVRTETLADGKIRVRTGPYTSRSEAEKIAEQVRAAGAQGVVVKTSGDKGSKPR